MVIHRVVHQVRRDQWRNHDGWDTNAELFEIKAVMIIVFVGDGIAGTDSGRWVDVVIEAALLIVGKKKNAVVSMW
jgi:hypothetical protein